jgi:hypothetical protein
MGAPIDRIARVLNTRRRTRGKDGVPAVETKTLSDFVMEASMKVQTDVKAGGGFLDLDIDLEIDLDIDLSFGGGCHKGCYKRRRRCGC